MQLSHNQKSKQQLFISKSYIGQGTFGKVQKCIRKSDNKIVAVKSIDVRLEQLDYIYKESDAMKKVNSDYTVQVLDHFYDPIQAAYIIVQPFYRRGNLTSIMPYCWNPKDILLFLYQMQRALANVSKNNIYHLDIKPDNILIKSEGQYVLCDFGCAQLLENVRTSKMLQISMSKGGGTTDYAPPQLILNNQASVHSDMWSLGVILYQIIYKKHPLRNQKKAFTIVLEQLFKQQIKIEYANKPGYEPLIKLCRQMLTVSKIKIQRITWDQLGKQIYSILQIHHRIPIITDIYQLIDYGRNVNSILCGLLYYIDVNKKLLQNYNIETKAIIQTSKTFLLGHIRSIYDSLQKNGKDYYIFDTTLKNYSQSCQLKIKHLVKRSTSFAKQVSFENIQLLNSKLLFDDQRKQFFSYINALQNKITIQQWKKMRSILVALQRGIQYSNKQLFKDLYKLLLYT